MAIHIHNIALEWAARNAEGRRQAVEIVEQIRKEDAPFILGHRVKLMIQKGEFGAVEVGFFHHIARELKK